MYHQFKELANVDITKEAMEVGPTTHYIMGGIRVDGDSQMSNVPGLFARAKSPRGCTEPTDWAANSLSGPCSCSARAGKYRAEFAKQNPGGASIRFTVDRAAKRALEHSSAARPAKVRTKCRRICRH